MVSAMKDRRFVMEAFAAGASDYITKPFQISDVCVRFLRATKDRPERAHCLEGIAARGAPANEPVKSPDEAILLDDVERAVSRDAFHSYLLHVKARLKIPMHVRAVRIADFLRVYSDTPGQELAQALLSVARMLSGLTRDSGDMVTYFGNGVFLTCSTTGSSIGAPSLKSMIEEAGMPSTDPHDKRQFDLIVGLDIPLEPDTHADVFDVLNRAIDSANPHDAA
jgi:CheY-like chemotaxis protein